MQHKSNKNPYLKYVFLVRVSLINSSNFAPYHGPNHQRVMYGNVRTCTSGHLSTLSGRSRSLTNVVPWTVSNAFRNVGRSFPKWPIVVAELIPVCPSPPACIPITSISFPSLRRRTGLPEIPSRCQLLSVDLFGRVESYRQMCRYDT